jgi:hypothetical protein
MPEDIPDGRPYTVSDYDPSTGELTDLILAMSLDCAKNRTDNLREAGRQVIGSLEP